MYSRVYVVFFSLLLLLLLLSLPTSHKSNNSCRESQTQNKVAAALRLKYPVLSLFYAKKTGNLFVSRTRLILS